MRSEFEVGILKLVLIDGNSLANRAFYAIPSLANRDGFPTNAVFGFLNMVNRVLRDEKPDYFAVAFDAGRKVFRHDMYAEYKKDRKGMPDDLRVQMPVLRDALDAMGLCWLELESYEADDLIGTLATRASGDGIQVRIVTGDKDCFQLIDNNTSVLFTRKGISELEVFDEAHLRDTYNIEPWQVVELKGLMGDNSDGIPGIPGIGEKTALKLLEDHKDVESVLAAAGAYSGKKLGERLSEHGELARLSRRLAVIDRDAPVAISVSELIPGTPDIEAKIRLYRELGFKGFLAEALREKDEKDTAARAAGYGEKAGGVGGAGNAGNVDGDGKSGNSGKSGNIENADSADSVDSAGYAANAKGGLDAGAQSLRRASGVESVREADILPKAEVFRDAEIIRDSARLNEYLSSLDNGGKLYLLPLTHDKNKRSYSWLSIALRVSGHSPVLLPIDTENDLTRYVSALKPYLSNEAIQKVFIDAKHAILAFKSLDAPISGSYADLSLMGYLLNPASPWQPLEGIEELEPDVFAKRIKADIKAKTGLSASAGSKRKTGLKENTESKESDGSIENAESKNDNGSIENAESLNDDVLNKLSDGLVNPKKVASWMAAIESLEDSLKRRLESEDMWELYKRAEEPLAAILGDMEWRGVRIDPDALREQGRSLRDKLKDEEEAIYRLAGQVFNINSPSQLGVILFEKMNLPKGKKMKTGYSTDADTLDVLARDYEIAGRILEYRQYAKLLSTYVDGLLAVMDAKTNRIHSSLNQTITVTGRLSSTEPNLQNIPIRMEEGRRIRKAFIASAGNRLLSGDYSQIELRVLAHLSGDEALTEAFRRGQDIHRSTAAEVFGVKPENVTPGQRQAAKAVNFGLIYGISDFGLAQDLGISRDEAKSYMDRYFRRYPGVKVYFDRLLADAAEEGFVRTMLNRRRYLPELRSSNYHSRSFGQRAAMNAPIQGTAADIMKLAMVGVKRLLEREGLGETMVLQVHDELLFDMPAERTKSIKEEIRSVMENVAPLSVPLVVDMKEGDNWYAMEVV